MTSQAAMRSDEALNVLNGLIEICRDGNLGYQEAAESIESAQIKSYFLEQSRMRAQFLGELQQEVHKLGGEPDNTGSTAAAIHRAWIDVKAALGGGDGAIVAACETGEDFAVKEYEGALQKQLPANLRTVVERQYQSVKQAHDQVRDWRDSLQQA